MAVHRGFESHSLNLNMNKTDWSSYQVYDPKNGVKLVSELTEKQAKTELCIAIELIERLLEFNQNAIDLVKNNKYST